LPPGQKIVTNSLGVNFMSVQVVKEGTTLIAKIAGDLDMVTGSQLKKEVDQRWDEYEKLNCLVLDLSQVNFTDSTGLGSILGRYKKVKSRDGRMVIVGAKGDVKDDLDIAGILRLCENENKEKGE